MEDINKKKGKLPPWLRRRIGSGDTFEHTSSALSGYGVETICNHANCPNRGECWSRGTATVLILGGLCTRDCKFCSVAAGKPLAPDATEPKRVAQLAADMKLKYLVLTSVTRDDLPDGGAAHFRDTVLEVKKAAPGIEAELLVPDFKGCQEKAIDILSDCIPFVFGHNIETVRQLFPVVRKGGDYELSLHLLKMVKLKYPDLQTKSSMMLGLGESDEQILQTLKDLKANGCDRVALGQYLKSSREAVDVAEYVTPEKFEYWDAVARELGFSWVMSSPYTRSSYHAETETGKL